MNTFVALYIGRFSPHIIDAMDETNVFYLVKLQIALGQAIGSQVERGKKDSARIFEDTLKVSLSINN